MANIYINKHNKINVEGERKYNTKVLQIDIKKR